MKTCLLSLLAACLVTAATAQKSFILSRQDKRGFIGVAAGPSWAVGRFADQQATDPVAGLAGKGFGAQVSGGFRISRTFGLAATFAHTQNRVLRDPLADQAVGRLGRTTTPWIIEAGFWQVRSLQMGPYLTLPFKRFSADLRVQGGYAFSSCPAVIVRGNQEGNALEMRTPQQQGQAPVYSAGTTLRYRLGKAWSFQVNADYQQTRFTYKDMLSSVRVGNQNVHSFSSGAKSLQVLTVSAGVTFLFANRRIL